MEVSGTPCGNGPVKSRVNGQSQLSVKQPLRAARSRPARRAMRTPATAALVGTEMSNGASSPDPSEMAVDTRSGRRRASALTTVSYTHLRAHETPEHLVCRLLL